jgi:ribonuclease BN (tRNA processing enzyme)
MHITFLGTGFSVPSAYRVQSGILVETDKHLILFDCGSGILRRLFQSGYSPLRISYVFFTHLHLDHNMDYLPLIKACYLMGKHETRIFGPKGTENWFKNLLRAYPYLKGRFKIELRELEDNESISLEGDNVKCKEVVHLVPSLAYRLDSSGSSMVYSGDTEPCNGIKKLCKGGVDVLIHECSSFKRYEGHTTPGQLAEFMKGLKVRKLILTHLSPEIEGKEKEIVEAINFKGETIIAKDLMRVKI